MKGESIRDDMSDLIYLVSCAVNETVPDAERVRDMDLAALFAAASGHMLAAAAAAALASAGVHDARFERAATSSLLRNAQMDAEMDTLFRRLEEAGIWYMPLKGVILQDLYPSYGMREMADRDILFDAGRAEDVRAVMEDLGFRTESFGETHHDCYIKEPVIRNGKVDIIGIINKIDKGEIRPFTAADWNLDYAAVFDYICGFKYRNVGNDLSKDRCIKLDSFSEITTADNSSALIFPIRTHSVPLY